MPMPVLRSRIAILPPALLRQPARRVGGDKPRARPTPNNKHTPLFAPEPARQLACLTFMARLTELTRRPKGRPAKKLFAPAPTKH